MSIKKFLTTAEEILSLKDSDTKIYTEGEEGYNQFVKGTLCYFDTDGSIIVSSEFGIGKGFMGKYILVEEPVKEADENDIAKLCKFWSDDPSQYIVGILYKFDGGLGVRPYYMAGSHWYKHCRLLTPAEVAEFTGYKLEE